MPVKMGEWRASRANPFIETPKNLNKLINSKNSESTLSKLWKIVNNATTQMLSQKRDNLNMVFK